MQVRIWRLSCVLMLVGSTGSFTMAQEIPTGPKAERYTQLWEHNPFAPAVAVTSAPQTSPLDGLFLSSWLRKDGRDVVILQNLQTNDTLTIGTEPNSDNLRLIRMNLNSDPRLVEAVISNGNERRAIKFRIDGQAQPPTVNGGASQPIEGGNAASAGSPASPLKKQSDQGQVAKATPENQGQPHRIYPGLPRVHHEGGLPQPPPTAAELAAKRAMARSKFNQPAADHP
jgi:hypothetical protein